MKARKKMKVRLFDSEGVRKSGSTESPDLEDGDNSGWIKEWAMLEGADFGKSESEGKELDGEMECEENRDNAGDSCMPHSSASWSSGIEGLLEEVSVTIATIEQDHTRPSTLDDDYIPLHLNCRESSELFCDSKCHALSSLQAVSSQIEATAYALSSHCKSLGIEMATPVYDLAAGSTNSNSTPTQISLNQFQGTATVEANSVSPQRNTQTLTGPFHESNHEACVESLTATNSTLESNPAAVSPLKPLPIHADNTSNDNLQQNPSSNPKICNANSSDCVESERAIESTNHSNRLNPSVVSDESLPIHNEGPELNHDARTDKKTESTPQPVVHPLFDSLLSAIDSKDIEMESLDVHVAMECSRSLSPCKTPNPSQSSDLEAGNEIQDERIKLCFEIPKEDGLLDSAEKNSSKRKRSRLSTNMPYTSHNNLLNLSNQKWQKTSRVLESKSKAKGKSKSVPSASAPDFPFKPNHVSFPTSPFPSALKTSKLKSTSNATPKLNSVSSCPNPPRIDTMSAETLQNSSYSTSLSSSTPSSSSNSLSTTTVTTTTSVETDQKVENMKSFESNTISSPIRTTNDETPPPSYASPLIATPPSTPSDEDVELKENRDIPTPFQGYADFSSSEKVCCKNLRQITRFSVSHSQHQLSLAEDSTKILLQQIKVLKELFDENVGETEKLKLVKKMEGINQKEKYAKRMVTKMSKESQKFCQSMKNSISKKVHFADEIGIELCQIHTFTS